MHNQYWHVSLGPHLYCDFKIEAICDTTLLQKPDINLEEATKNFFTVQPNFNCLARKQVRHKIQQLFP